MERSRFESGMKKWFFFNSCGL